MLKALADRLAEAFAERLHQRVRTDLWGYAPDEALTQRRADRREVPRHPPGARLSGVPGPHASSATMFERAAARDEIGMALTESLAMMPAASVSGFYLAHPRGDVLQRRPDRRDQLDDLGQRASARHAPTRSARWRRCL